MPRDSGGNYSLPAGNPVVDGTLITPTWANPTMSDIAVQLNNVITRDGLLGFINPVKAIDGSAAAPAYSFASAPTIGMYRQASTLRFSILGTYVGGWSATGLDVVGNVLAAGNIALNFATNTEAGVKVFGSNTPDGLGRAAINVVHTTNGAGSDSQIEFLTNRFGVNRGTRMFIDPYGRVQINAPVSGYPFTARWAVNDGATFGGTASGAVRSDLHLGSAPESSGVIFWYDRATGNAGFSQAGAPGGAKVDVLTWNANRNVTIQTPAAGGTLTVGAITNQAAIFVSDGTTQSLWQPLGASGTNFGSFTNHDLRLVSNNQLRMTIAAAGTVSIATPAAGPTLTVNAGLSSSTIIANAAASNYGLQINAASASWSGILMQQNAVSRWGLLVDNFAVGAFSLYNLTRNAEGLTVSSNGNFTIHQPASGSHEIRGTDVALLLNGAGGTYVAMQLQASGTNSSYLFLGNATSGERARVYADNFRNFIISTNNGTDNALIVNANGVTTLSTPSGGTESALVVQNAGNYNLGSVAKFMTNGTGNDAARILFETRTASAGGPYYWGIGGRFSAQSQFAITLNATATNQGADVFVIDGSTGLCFVQPLSGAPVAGVLEVGYRRVPRIAVAGGTAAASQHGSCLATTAGVTIPASTFAAGEAISIYNDSASAITITQGASLTLRQAGTANTGNRTLAARGMATIWFNSATVAVISGAGLT